MIDKRVRNLAEAVAGVPDGAVVLCGGFGGAGLPEALCEAVFEELYTQGRIELELVPQGTMSERMRCAAAGLGGFYSPVSVGTRLAEGKEHREIGRASCRERV